MMLPLLSVLLHAYVAWRLLPGWSGLLAAQSVLMAALAVSTVLVPWGLRRPRLKEPHWDHALEWAALLAMGLFSSLFVLTVLRDATLLAGAAVHAWRPDVLGDGALARWQVLSARGVPALALLASAVGFLNARRTARVVSVDVPIPDLPAALHGFTIAQISDIHVGLTIREPYLRGVVEAVNRLEADVVAITGDLVDGKVHHLAPHVAPLADLRSRLGTFFVTGNHEYYSGAHQWIEALPQFKVRVLMNEHVVLPRGDAALILAGVTDFTAHLFDPAHKSDPRAALAGAPPDIRTRVLLAHQPRSAPAAAEAGFQLQISGHTHGGQFLPWRFFVPLQQPFVAGLKRWGGMWIYISRGTGYWGPPKRLGAPSEITRLRLIPAA